MTIHTLKDMMGEMLIDAKNEIVDMENCIECMESRISDCHLHILWNRGRIDTICKMFDDMDEVLDNDK